MSVKNSEQITGKFTHWCLTADADALVAGKRRQPERQNHTKPAGMWLSWNGGWEQFCETWESWMEGRTCLRASIKPGLKILEIDCMADLDEAFTGFEQNPVETYPEDMLVFKQHHEQMKECMKDMFPGDHHLRRYDFSVAPLFWHWLQTKGYAGVALTERGQWQTRMPTFLYGWDCASICIFDPNNVTFSKELEVENNGS